MYGIKIKKKNHYTGRIFIHGLILSITVNHTIVAAGTRNTEFYMATIEILYHFPVIMQSEILKPKKLHL